MKFYYKIIIAILAVLIVVLYISFLYQYKTAKSLKELNYNLKKEIIQNDSIEEVRDGLYKKLVNDLYSVRELNEKVKAESESLYREIDKYKILYYGVIDTSGQDFDTIPEESDVNEFKKTYTSYYPNPTNPFIRHTLTTDFSGSQANFEIFPFKLSYTIVEDELEFQRIYFDTPEWLKIDDIRVSSVNKSQDRYRERFSIYAGLGVNTLHTKEVYGKLTLQNKKFMYSTSIGKDIFLLDISFKLY